ncbi:MAG: hypothetical protein IPL04_17065 [Chitinophagaceae bacterium]|nr:hypothetical protein [Chitinophagaceae bacterium]
MTKYTALILIIAMRIFFHPSNAQTEISPFGSLPSFPQATTTFSTPKFISIEGKISNEKVKLTWNISENETADKFEVEKSVDGKTFLIAALVFGTDKMNSDQYQFYEKVNSGKILYRIKLINKNKELEYSKL